MILLHGSSSYIGRQLGCDTGDRCSTVSFEGFQDRAFELVEFFLDDGLEKAFITDTFSPYDSFTWKMS